MDYREEFLTTIRNSLINKNCPTEYLNLFIDTIIIDLDSYELTPRCTEVAVRDTSSEQLLKIYQGTLLTEGKSKNTVYGYIRLLTRFMNDMEVPLYEVDVFQIRIWLTKEQQNCSLRTCENYRSYLSAFYQWLLKEEIIKKNPMVKINPIKYTDEIKLPFSEVEIDLLRKSCSTLRDRAIFELLLSSGIRVSELCSLNINDIDFNNKIFTVRHGKGDK